MTPEAILAGPDRIICQPLRANISRKQCQINQRRAWRAEREGRRIDMKDWGKWARYSEAGMLRACLTCRGPKC